MTSQTLFVYVLFSEPMFRAASAYPSETRGSSVNDWDVGW